jgi:hypothetical protein
MIDHAAARSLVRWRLAAMPALSPDDEWVVLEDCTIERDSGWVFFYDSRLFRETGDSCYIIAGNSPFFVRRADGAVFVTGTAHPIEVYIQDIETGSYRFVSPSL